MIPTSWTIHLASRRPGRAAIAVIIILFAILGIAALLPPQWDVPARFMMLALTAVLLISSIAEFLFPITFTLDEDGAHARVLFSHRVLPWSRVRRVYLLCDGIKLSPLTMRGWLESYRGVLLRTTDREAVLAGVRGWLQAAGVEPEIEES